MINIIIRVVKKRQLSIIKKNKELIKEKERNKYMMISKEERNKIKERSLERYYKLKAQYKE